jgi:hypothetical protein
MAVCRVGAIATTVSFLCISHTISAIVLSRKLVLLTRNHRDLGKVPGFLIEIVTV